MKAASCGFNSMQFIFVPPNITNYKLHSEGFTIRTHTTSLTSDLTSDQEKLSRNRRKKTLKGVKKKKMKHPSGKQQRRIPLQDGQNNR